MELSMDSLRYRLVHRHAHTTFPALALVTSFFAGAHTLIPVSVFLATLILYGPWLYYRRRSGLHFFTLTVALALSKTLRWIMAAWTGLTSPASAVAALIAASGVTAAIAVAVLMTSVYLKARIPSAVAQVIVFPTLWAATWWCVVHVSPLGRLTIWTPVFDAPGYAWLLSAVGPLANDWIAAAWGVIGAEAAGQTIMGQARDEEQSLLDGPQSSSVVSTTSKTKLATTGLTTFLLALAIPSFFIDNTPLAATTSGTTTALTIGCVLPPRVPGRALSFEDYLKETSHLWNAADVLLWPESAVRFDSKEARDDAFAELAGNLKKYSKALIGVGFIDTTVDAADGTGESTVQRNGVAFISRDSDKPQLLYYKRHLVPFAESFALSSSPPPPEIFNYGISVKGQREQRPVPISTSICLDFAMPNPFAELASKPAIVLAPAYTWERTIGEIMWQQVRERAIELDTTVLFCDGGHEGFSGVASKGISEAVQTGRGSWTRAIGIPYPFDDARSIYGTYGDWVPLVLALIACALGMSGNLASSAFERLQDTSFERLNPVGWWRRRRENHEPLVVL